jgi:alcohol dehydrogenase (cytochrome c)
MLLTIVSGASGQTVWDGVFTEAQAMRGQAVYAAPCGRCHGHKLDGAPDDPDMFPAPPIGGWKFLRNWNGRTLAMLYEYTVSTMPANNPGFLSAQEFVDLLAYMLWASGAPAGPAELLPNPQRLGQIAVAPRPPG